MSISPISGVAQHLAAAPSAQKPESSEALGRPDHDGDGDDGAAPTLTGAVARRDRPGELQPQPPAGWGRVCITS